MDPELRDRFDLLVDEVLANLPPLVHKLIEKIPLHVEDYPSDDVLATVGVRDRGVLCGLFTGIPITHQSIQFSGYMPDVVTIYREGILHAAADRRGRVTGDRLREEIRKTILHELGHFHGLDEDDLANLGYG